jgi:uncharacterized protein (UPF0264 family)
VLRFVQDHGWDTLLLDTWCKDGRTLLDWLPKGLIFKLREACQGAGIRLALAGSLGVSEIASLMPLAPEWFAVRGAVCHEGRREAGIDVTAVRRLLDLLNAPVKVPIGEN